MHRCQGASKWHARPCHVGSPRAAMLHPLQSQQHWWLYGCIHSHTVSAWQQQHCSAAAQHTTAPHTTHVGAIKGHMQGPDTLQQHARMDSPPTSTSCKHARMDSPPTSTSCKQWHTADHPSCLKRAAVSCLLTYIAVQRTQQQHNT
jgi:hypothetical protein